MSKRKKRTTEPTRRRYQTATAIRTDTDAGRAQLWHERLARANDMLFIEGRHQYAQSQLVPLIDGTYPDIIGGDQVYLNEALPALEEVIYGAFPRLPPVQVEPRQIGQEGIAEMCKALIDGAFSSGLIDAYPAVLMAEWDELAYGIGITKLPWKKEWRDRSYRPTNDPSILAAEYQRAQQENADPTSASVVSEDDDAIHVMQHEEAIAQYPPDSPESEAMMRHIQAHLGRMEKLQWANPQCQRVAPWRFLYDPDAERWEERRWEAELCDEHLTILERTPGIKNLNPQNCPAVDEFDNPHEGNWRKSSEFDFESTRLKIWKIHDRINDSWTFLPYKTGNEIKPILEEDWPYTNLELYERIVHRPFPGRVHGLSTLHLIRPVLLELAKVNSVIRKAARRSAGYGLVTSKGSLTASEQDDLYNIDKPVKEVNPQGLALMKEFKPPALPRELIEYREMLQTELRRVLGSDVITQGGDTQHQITATEAGVRSQRGDERTNRRQQQVSELLSRIARTTILEYRLFAPEEEDLLVRVAGPLGMEAMQLNPASIPEDLIVKVDVSAATDARRVEDVQAAQTFIEALTTLAPGQFNVPEVLMWYGNRLGVDNPDRFFTGPGGAPVVPAVGGGAPMTGGQQPAQPPQAQPQQAQPQMQPQV